MASNVPVSAPLYTDLVDDSDWVRALHVNRLGDDVTAIATMVGILGKAQSWAVDFASYMKNQKVPLVTKKDADEIYVSEGAIWIANSGQTVRIPRRNTGVTTITAADLDTGTMQVGFYYIYAVADSAATTFTVKFSASATAPTGLTNFELIGWFYNETAGVLDITSGFLGNVKRFGVRNILVIENTTDTSTTSTSYVNASPAAIKFYAPSRKIIAKCFAHFYGGGDNHYGAFTWSVDGSDNGTSEVWPVRAGTSGATGQSGFQNPAPFVYAGAIAADTTTLIPRVKSGDVTYTVHMHKKFIVIEEL